MSTCHERQKIPSLGDSLQLQLDMGMSMPERVLARLSSGWTRAKRVEWLLFSNLASTLSKPLLLSWPETVVLSRLYVVYFSLRVEET